MIVCDCVFMYLCVFVFVCVCVWGGGGGGGGGDQLPGGACREQCRLNSDRVLAPASSTTQRSPGTI